MEKDLNQIINDAKSRISNDELKQTVIQKHINNGNGKIVTVTFEKCKTGFKITTNNGSI